MTITHHAPHPAPGCTCIHAAGLHRPADGHRAGCRVGWTGAGTPIPGAPDLRTWPTGCPCTATGPTP